MIRVKEILNLIIKKLSRNIAILNLIKIVIIMMNIDELINAENTLFGHKMNNDIQITQTIEMVEGNIVVYEQYYSQHRLEKILEDIVEQHHKHRFDED